MVEKMQQLRVYADTSVFGGMFDPEFAEASDAFFSQIRSGRFNLVTSAVVQEEPTTAPVEVQAFFSDMLDLADIADVTEAALELQEAYLDGGIVTPRWAADALHVALATVAQCTLIVSWNFKHIVHYQKIPLYNAVNTLQGYQNISIYSPREVIAYEDEDT